MRFKVGQMVWYKEQHADGKNQDVVRLATVRKLGIATLLLEYELDTGSTVLSWVLRSECDPYHEEDNDNE